MGEDEEEEENADDGGDATAPPPLAPLAALPKEIDEEGHVEAIPEQEAPVFHEVVPADVEPMVP
jgi:hypothetical protein